MYHLIITAKEGAWNGDPHEFDLSRALREGTDAGLTSRYGSLSETQVTELLGFPALFAYESYREADAQLGYLTRVRRRSDRVLVEYAIYPGLPKIPAETLERLEWDLDIEPWERSRTHWALKGVSLMGALSEAGLLTDAQIGALPPHVAKSTRAGVLAPLAVSPTVFTLPNHERDPTLVSVMMPFDAGFAPVYQAIRDACSAAGLQCRRADDIWQESEIMQDVFTLLYRSRIVLVDFTGRNPNVMYETGIAHTLGRPVVPITQSIDDVPFDLRHHRVLKYLPNGEGLSAMRETLLDRLRVLAGNVHAR